MTDTAKSKPVPVADIARWVKHKTRLGAPLHDTNVLVAALEAHGGEPTPLDPGQEPTLPVPTPEPPAEKPEPKEPITKKK